MSRELHDTLLQDLVGITLHFDELAATLEDSFGTAAGQAVRLRRYLERAIGEARQAVWDLRSAHPEEHDNAARHADATSVTLTLDYRATDIVLRVSDNGRGCQPTDYSGHTPGHYGFLIMRERADQVGGRFQVEASPGDGMIVEVAIPGA